MEAGERLALPLLHGAKLVVDRSPVGQHRFGTVPVRGLEDPDVDVALGVEVGEVGNGCPQRADIGRDYRDLDVEGVVERLEVA